MNLAAPGDPQASPPAYNSLGLRALLDRIRDDRSYTILDLGPALEANVRFWSEFSCRLHIHDLYGRFRENKAAARPGEDSAETTISALLDFSEVTVFDIILAWDLFNYLDLRELEAFVQKLGRWCRRGTRLFALVSSLPRISALPLRIRILSREQLTCELSSERTRPCPRHSPRDIARVMGRFTVSRSFLSRHGIQEYIFTFE